MPIFDLVISKSHSACCFLGTRCKNNSSCPTHQRQTPSKRRTDGRTVRLFDT